VKLPRESEARADGGQLMGAHMSDGG